MFKVVFVFVFFNPIVSIVVDIGYQKGKDAFANPNCSNESYGWSGKREIPFLCWELGLMPQPCGFTQSACSC